MDIDKIITNLNESSNEKNLDINTDINKNIIYKPKVIIPNSTGLKIWWLLGIYDSLRSQHINIQDNIFLSWSAGAIATALYLSDVSGKYFIQKSFNLLQENYGNLDSIFLVKIAHLMRPIFEEIFPEDCHLKCNNRLHIIYYNFPFTYQTKSQFSSKTDLIDHLIMCSYIPFITNNISNNDTLSDTFIGIPNDILYNFIDYRENQHVDIYRFYYWELHQCSGILEKLNYFYFCDRKKVIDIYNSGIQDSNILIYKFNLNEFKNKNIHNYLPIKIYETKKFKIKKKQKRLHIFRQLFRFITIITAFYMIIYYATKIISY